MITDLSNSAPPTLELTIGIPGFSYADLHQPRRLRDLLDVFDRTLAAADPALAERYMEWRTTGGRGLGPVATSDMLVAVAPHVSRFVGRLFGISAEVDALADRIAADDIVLRFKRDFLQRRVFGRFKAGADPGEPYAHLAGKVATLFAVAFPSLHFNLDQERSTAIAVMFLFDLDRALAEGKSDADVEATSLLTRLAADSRGLITFSAGDAPADGIRSLVDLLERWSFARTQDPAVAEEIRHWASYHRPENMDYQHLVQIQRPNSALPELQVGPPSRLRRRDGFALTDRRMDHRHVLGEVHYCIYCHERDKDSCSKGLHTAKDGPLKKNPLGITLAGCPLDEKISEAHFLMKEGLPVAAIAAICVDNPMLPGTGHRICNDCMKSCIYQKQEPVNIPQIETGVLTDVLGLPWGFEVWSLLTRWNPLNPSRPVALPYNGKNVLVVGLGPAGYTLAHHLTNEGFGIVGIDGLKIEPLPRDLVGDSGQAPRPLRNIHELTVELDQRVLAGFGGVSEYGITVRWDKNFLTLLYLNLVRRQAVRFYGGVRFGGTLGIDDAWEMGFDHIAIAAGAGKPTVVDMKNKLIRGIRTASDFLMALQLTGAFKESALANLQVQLPALVIGGGLTAIDTATELAAYYPVQVEKTLERFEALEAALGSDHVWSHYSEEDRQILTTFLDHGRAVRAERARAIEAGEDPNFVPLVREWGGVSLVYRKGMADAPAYRLNHEEIVKALEEGIFFVEKLSPVEAIPDRFGAVQALRFERMTETAGKWSSSGTTVELVAKTVCMAAGTSPNIIYQREHPGTFTLDKRDEFFLSHQLVQKDAAAGNDVSHNGGNGVQSGASFELKPVERGGAPGFFTSYEKNGRFITYYGDNHPVYAGNVVKAMASAKDGFHSVVHLFEDEVRGEMPEDEPARLSRFRALTDSLDADLRPTVVRVERLTPTIVDVIVRAPLAARKFQPGQFYRLQNFEVTAPEVMGTRLMMEGIALTGAWVDREQGLLSLIVLEMGVSSRLCASLVPGQPVVVMGPTGAPTEIPRGETVLLAGGGLGNAVLFSIARALRDSGNTVVYFAGYKKKDDFFKRDEIEAATDLVIWSVDSGEMIEATRPQDYAFRGNIVQAMIAYAEGQLGKPPLVPLSSVDRVIAIGSDRMMAAVKAARHEVLAPYLTKPHVGIGSINSPMQCMMKEVCGQCLQQHVDPATGAISYVFSCFNQDQKLDEVDFKNLNERLKVNSVAEKLSSLWLDLLLTQADLPRV